MTTVIVYILHSTLHLSSGHPSVGQDILLQRLPFPLRVKQRKTQSLTTAVLQPLDGALRVNMITLVLSRSL